MPAVDIPSPDQAGSKQGFGTGLPTPILLAVVGGGIGILVFLSKRSGSNAGTGADKGTLLPNTAIMLGSLQQGILNLQGQVSTGNADLSSQLTGVGENLGTQIDAQSGQIQQSFADLNTYLSGNFQNLQGSETALSQAIAGLGTQNADLASSLSVILGNLHQLDTGLQNTQTYLGGMNAGITAGLGSLGQQVSGVSGQVQQNQGELVNVMNGVQTIQNGQNSMRWTIAGKDSWITARTTQLMNVAGMGQTQANQTATAEWNLGYVQSNNIAYGYPGAH